MIVWDSPNRDSFQFFSKLTTLSYCCYACGSAVIIAEGLQFMSGLILKCSQCLARLTSNNQRNICAYQVQAGTLGWHRSKVVASEE